MKKIALLLVIFIFAQASMSKAEEVSLTVDEAIAIALRDNRDVLLKTEDIKKQKAKIEEAKSALYPTFNVAAGWTLNRGYSTKDFSYETGQLTLKQYLYKGGKTVNNIKYNEYLTKVNEAILDKTKLETAANVKKSFYTLLFASRYTLLNKAILNNTLKHLRSTEARYKTGEASESDILKIRSSLESVRHAYVTSLGQVVASQALLNNYLYLDKDVKVAPKGEFTYSDEDIAYDEALLEALKARPEIRQYENQALAYERYVEVVKAEGRPSIYASWDYYNRSHASTGTAKNWSDYNIIGVTFSWPVFDGWATRSKIDQTNIDLKEAQIAKEKARMDIVLELKNAYLLLRNAISKINTVDSDEKVYKDNLMALRQKFNEGIASLLDIQDGILKYSIAKFNKTQAVYDYIIAKTSLDKAMGGI